MPHTLLDVPFAPAELGDLYHSADLVRELVPAYALLKRGKYSAAHARIEPLRGTPMSERQRLRVSYILATAAAGLKDHQTAIALLEEAVDRAEHIEELDAFAELAFLLACQLDNLDCWTDSSESCTAALAAWHSRPHPLSPTDLRADPLDVSFEIDLHDRLGLEFFMNGKLDESSRHLLTAYSLTPHATKSAMRAAALQWTLALVERWRGNPQRARDHAAAAFEVYNAAGDTFERARLQIVIADIGLDLATAISPTNAFESRSDALRLVERHLLQALATIGIIGHDPSYCRALLTFARYERVAAHNTNRLTIIESAQRIAERLDDNLLRGMVCTEFGDELAHLGSREAAIRSYQLALDAFSRTQTPGLTVWTHRALNRILGR